MATATTLTTITTMAATDPTVCSPEKCNGEACSVDPFQPRIQRRGHNLVGDDEAEQIMTNRLTGPDDADNGADGDADKWWERMRALIEALGTDYGPEGAARSRAAFRPFAVVDDDLDVEKETYAQAGGVVPVGGCVALSVIGVFGAYTAYIWESTLKAGPGSQDWAENIVRFFREGDRGWVDPETGAVFNRSPALAKLVERGPFNPSILGEDDDISVHLMVRAHPNDDSIPAYPDQVDELADYLEDLLIMPQGNTINVVPYVPDYGDAYKSMLAWQFAPNERQVDNPEGTPTPEHPDNAVIWVQAARLWWGRQVIWRKEWIPMLKVTCSPLGCGGGGECLNRPFPDDRLLNDAIREVVGRDGDVVHPQTAEIGYVEWMVHMDVLVQGRGANYGPRKTYTRNGQTIRIHELYSNSKVELLDTPGSAVSSGAYRTRPWGGGVWQTWGCAAIVVVSDQAIYTAHI